MWSLGKWDEATDGIRNLVESVYPETQEWKLGPVLVLVFPCGILDVFFKVGCLMLFNYGAQTV